MRAPMAYVVCYSWFPPEDHTKNGAIYLEQRFYELIFKHCRDQAGPFVILREIALLKYKSPTLVVNGEQIRQLHQELAMLAGSQICHPQIAELRQVCNNALSEGCALTISGDMYPELW